LNTFQIRKNKKYIFKQKIYRENRKKKHGKHQKWKKETEKVKEKEKEHEKMPNRALTPHTEVCGTVQVPTWSACRDGGVLYLPLHLCRYRIRSARKSGRRGSQ
jgi:hypothetical protein